MVTFHSDLVCVRFIGSKGYCGGREGGEVKDSRDIHAAVQERSMGKKGKGGVPLLGQCWGVEDRVRN